MAETIGLQAELELRQFQRGVDQYLRELDRMGNETSLFAFNVVENFQTLGAVVAGVGATLATTVGLAAAKATRVIENFTTESIGNAAQLQDELANIAAVLGKSLEEIEPMRDFIEELAIDPKLKVDTFETAAAIEMLAKNGMELEKIMGGATKATIALANATGGEFAMSADVVTDIINIFGLQTEELGEIVGGTTAVVVKSKFSLDDYFMAIANGGQIAKNVGVSFEDFNAALIGVAPAFNSGRRAGTGLGTALLNLVPKSKQAAMVMAGLGMVTEDGIIKFYDAQGAFLGIENAAQVLQDTLGGLSEAERNFFVRQIFGIDAQEAIIRLMELGAEGIQKIKAEMADVDAFKAAETRMKTLSGRWEVFQGIMEALRIDFGYKLIPPLTRGLEALNEVLEDNFNEFGKMGDVVAMAFDRVIDALIPLVRAWIPKLTIWTNKLADYLVRVIETGKIFNDALGDLPEPIRKVVEYGQRALRFFDNLIQNIILAGKWIWNLLEPWYEWMRANVTFEDVLTAMSIAVGLFILPFVNAIVQLGLFAAAVVSAITILRDAWESNWGGIREFTDQVLERIKTIFDRVLTIIENILDNDLLGSLEKGFRALQPVILRVLDAIIWVLDQLVLLSEGNWRQAWENLKAVVFTAIDEIMAYVQEKINSIDWSAIKTEALQLWDDLAVRVSAKITEWRLQVEKELKKLDIPGVLAVWMEVLKEEWDKALTKFERWFYPRWADIFNRLFGNKGLTTEVQVDPVTGEPSLEYAFDKEVFRQYVENWWADFKILWNAQLDKFEKWFYPKWADFFNRMFGNKGLTAEMVIDPETGEASLEYAFDKEVFIQYVKDWWTGFKILWNQELNKFEEWFYPRWASFFNRMFSDKGLTAEAKIDPLTGEPFLEYAFNREQFNIYVKEWWANFTDMMEAELDVFEIWFANRWVKIVNNVLSQWVTATVKFDVETNEPFVEYTPTEEGQLLIDRIDATITKIKELKAAFDETSLKKWMDENVGIFEWFAGLSGAIAVVYGVNIPMLLLSLAGLTVAFAISAGLIQEAWSTNWGNIRSIVEETWPTIKSIGESLLEIGKRIWEALGPGIEASVKGLTASISTVLTGVDTALKKLIEWLDSEEGGKRIGGFFKDIYEWTISEEGGVAVITWLGTKLSEAGTAFVTWLNSEEGGQRILGYLKSVYEWTISEEGGVAVITWLGTKLSEAGTAFVTWLNSEEGGQALKKFFDTTLPAAIGTTLSKIEELRVQGNEEIKTFWEETFEKEGTPGYNLKKWFDEDFIVATNTFQEELKETFGPEFREQHINPFFEQLTNLLESLWSLILFVTGAILGLLATLSIGFNRTSVSFSAMAEHFAEVVAFVLDLFTLLANRIGAISYIIQEKLAQISFREDLAAQYREQRLALDREAPKLWESLVESAKDIGWVDLFKTTFDALSIFSPIFDPKFLIGKQVTPLIDAYQNVTETWKRMSEEAGKSSGESFSSATTEGIVSGMKQNLDSVSSSFGGIVGAVDPNPFYQKGEELGTGIIGGMATGLNAQLPTVTENIKGFGVEIGGAFLTWEQIYRAAGVNSMEELRKALGDGQELTVEQVTAFFTGLGALPMIAKPGYLEAGTGAGTAYVEGLGKAQGISSAKALEMAQAVVGVITTESSKLPGVVGQTGADAGKSLTERLQSAAELSAPEALYAITNLIVEEAANISAGMETTGEDAIDGLIRGMYADKEMTLQEAYSVASMILGALTGPDGFDTQSPSKKTKAIGEDVTDGLILGMQSKEKDLLTATNKIWDSVASTIIEGTEGTASLAEKMSTFIKQLFGSIAFNIPIDKDYGQKIVDAMHKLWTTVAGTVMEDTGSSGSLFSKLADAFKKLFKGIAFDIPLNLDYGRKIVDAMYRLWQDVADTVNQDSGGNQSLSSLFKTAFSTFFSTMNAEIANNTTLRDSFKTLGTNIGTGFVEGINSQVAAAQAAAAALVNATATATTQTAQIASPSKRWEKYGEFTGEGYIQGIENEMDYLGYRVGAALKLIEKEIRRFGVISLEMMRKVGNELEFESRFAQQRIAQPVPALVSTAGRTYNTTASTNNNFGPIYVQNQMDIAMLRNLIRQTIAESI